MLHWVAPPTEFFFYYYCIINIKCVLIDYYYDMSHNIVLGVERQITSPIKYVHHYGYDVICLFCVVCTFLRFQESFGSVCLLIDRWL